MRGLVFLFSCGAFAQQRINVAPELGLNFTQVDGDRYAGYHRIGMHVGAVARLPLFAQKVNPFLLVAVAYSEKGSRNKPHRYVLTLNYAQGYVLLGVDDVRGELGGAAGVIGGGLVRYREEAEGQQLHNQDAYRRIDLLGAVQVWVRIGAHLNVVVQASYSLISVRKWMPQGAPVPWQKNNVITVGVRWWWLPYRLGDE